MLKFIRQNITSLDGVEIYPMISLIIFVTVFTGMLIWVIKKDRKEIDEYKRIPLNDD